MITTARRAVSQMLGRHQARAIGRWCRRCSEPLNLVAKALNVELWRETEAYCHRLSANPDLQRRMLSVGLSPAECPWSAEFGLLYFLTRHIQPQTVVETGVSLGWSSRAILDAMDVNGMGILYSSETTEDSGGPDFSVATIGLLVDDRSRWRLMLDGDRTNVPRIVAEVERIDLFHYDSDKSYAGREFVLGAIQSRLHRGSVLVIDDIKDNWHFRHWVEAQSGWHVLTKDVALLRGAEAWIGMVGL